jgi:hypothetical protein
MLRELIMGIAVWLPAMVFASVSWSQSQPNRVKPTTGWYDTGYGYSDYSPIDYSEEIKKSLARLNSEAERLAIDHILADLATKSSSEIFGLKLATDVCQEIACRGVSPDTAHRYVDAFADKRVSDDAHQTALRNAAAAERNTFIAAAAAGVSLLSLLVSGLSYRRTGRNTKSAIPA